jgi:pimeloyl-ACP methyl ester carboxylesterase
MADKPPNQMTITYTQEQPTTRGTLIKLNNLELYYEELGAGEPLLLLHGFGGSVQNWYSFTDELAAQYRLILVDMRGHGYSTNPDNFFTHGAAAHDVLQLLDELHIERCAAIGISSGGMVLLHIARLQPERFATMVLISTTTHFPEQARAIMRSASFARMPAPVQAMYRTCAQRGDVQIQQLIAQFNLLGDNYEDMNFSAQELAAIRSRTLVIHGDRDRFFPADIALHMCSAIPNASSWIIAGGDHDAIYTHQIPFCQHVLQFLVSA